MAGSALMPLGPVASRLFGGRSETELGPRSGQPRPATSGQAPTEQEIPPERRSPGHPRAIERSSGETESRAQVPVREDPNCGRPAPSPRPSPTSSPELYLSLAPKSFELPPALRPRLLPMVSAARSLVSDA